MYSCCEAVRKPNYTPSISRCALTGKNNPPLHPERNRHRVLGIGCSPPGWMEFGKVIQKISVPCLQNCWNKASILKIWLHTDGELKSYPHGYSNKSKVYCWRTKINPPPWLSPSPILRWLTYEKNRYLTLTSEYTLRRQGGVRWRPQYRIIGIITLFPSRACGEGFYVGPTTLRDQRGSLLAYLLVTRIQRDCS